jgi:acyl-CoA synthetase (AMP-forming)/AMP-acid ligase II
MSLPELIDQTAAVAAALAALGVRHHDRVLIMLPDGPGFDESSPVLSIKTQCPCR